MPCGLSTDIGEHAASFYSPPLSDCPENLPHLMSIGRRESGSTCPCSGMNIACAAGSV